MITTWHGCEEARQGIRGTFSQLDDPVHYHEIPGIFMIVADPVGADIVDLTWEKIGQCFDADGVTVDSENGLQGALCGALKSGRTTLIGARIDGSGSADQFNALRELSAMQIDLTGRHATVTGASSGLG